MKKKLFLLPITLTALAPMISVVGCGDKEPKADITIDLTIDKTSSLPMTESETFQVELNKIYRFNVNASICPEESFADASIDMGFLIYKDNISPLVENIDASILRVTVGDNVFQSVKSLKEIVAGKYCYADKVLYFRDYSVPTPSFTMSVDLQFIGDAGESVIARWGPS